MSVNHSVLSRREFLRAAGVLAGGLVTGFPGIASADSPDGETSTLSDHLFVHHGPINVGIVRDGSRALLIDCGDASVGRALESLRITFVDRILFTHHHRDQACGAAALAAGGAKIVVPDAERDHFDKVADYWNSPKSRWHIYSQHPHHLMLAEPVRVDATLRPGDTIHWGPATIRVLATPGHTDGSLGYLVEVDGRRVAFSGDAIYDAGRVWEIHSLQKGTQTTDYHGFLGARPELVESLGRLKDAKPDALVPSHGRVMTDPAGAIDLLVERLARCYDKYVAISALRHYFPKMFTEYADRKDHMAIRPGKPAPECLHHIGTTWVLVSKDGGALVMDCGSPVVIEKLKGLVAGGEIRAVEGLWVTHYHDDHVDAIPAFQKEFDCPCITDAHVAEVIANPRAWRLPCISPSVARVDRVAREGESWPWHEFKLTAYHFPGQTLYHSGLFVEGQGLRMLFTGDSCTMAGIDDYCTSNRNWLGSGVGFDRCLALIEELKPSHLFNCHVDVAWDFTPDECRFMRENLAEREKLYGELVPWDHANYGMDEPWVRCFPYEQSAEPGGNVACEVVVTNHSSGPRKAACRAAAPRGWTAPNEWTTIEVPAKTEGKLRLSLRVAPDAPPGRHVVPVDLRYGPWTLPQYIEAIVVV